MEIRGIGGRRGSAGGGLVQRGGVRIRCWVGGVAGASFLHPAVKVTKAAAVAAQAMRATEEREGRTMIKGGRRLLFRRVAHRQTDARDLLLGRSRHGVKLSVVALADLLQFRRDI